MNNRYEAQQINVSAKVQLSSCDTVLHPQAHGWPWHSSYAVGVNMNSNFISKEIINQQLYLFNKVKKEKKNFYERFLELWENL